MRRRIAAVLFSSVVPAGLAADGGMQDVWQDLPPLAVARQEVGVAELGGRVYVIGGILEDRSVTGRVDRYDLADGRWDTVPSLPDGARLHHVGVAAAAGLVYAIGGLNMSFRGVDSVFAFDPETGEWTPRANLPSKRGSMGVAAVDGVIYAAGGQSGSESFNDFAAYNPEEDEWRELGPMPTVRNHLAAVGYGGFFFAVGGRSGSLKGAFEAYDPVAEEWSRLPDLPTPRAGIAAGVTAGAIFVFGGEGNSAHPDGIFPHVESFALPLGRWFSHDDMPHPRHGVGAAVDPASGGIVIPGGAPVQGFGATDVVDVFCPGEPRWSRELFVRGDSNADGRVDITDGIDTLLFLFTLADDLDCEDGADSNDSGEVNITDAIYTLEYLFVGGPRPPPPGPHERGSDPTFDTLFCRGG